MSLCKSFSYSSSIGFWGGTAALFQEVLIASGHTITPPQPCPPPSLLSLTPLSSYLLRGFIGAALSVFPCRQPSPTCRPPCLHHFPIYPSPCALPGGDVGWRRVEIQLTMRRPQMSRCYCPSPPMRLPHVYLYLQ